LLTSSSPARSASARSGTAPGSGTATGPACPAGPAGTSRFDRRGFQGGPKWRRSRSVRAPGRSRARSRYPRSRCRRAASRPRPALTIEAVLAALDHPVRLRVVRTLADGSEQTRQQIRPDMTKSSASHHWGTAGERDRRAAPRGPAPVHAAASHRPGQPLPRRARRRRARLSHAASAEPCTAAEARGPGVSPRRCPRAAPCTGPGRRPASRRRPAGPPRRRPPWSGRAGRRTSGRPPGSRPGRTRVSG
jgi:hypothetical protein